MTQSTGQARPDLTRLREAAKGDPRLRFNNLLHHIDEDLLRAAYKHLNRRAAKGVDGEDWTSYGVGLEEKLTDLCRRLHTNGYRSQPVLRQWVPKADGGQRPIGITALEDKIVQQAVVWVLEAVYEPLFMGFSYGFRPGRGQHDALDAVHMAITTRKVSWVLDADIKGYFDTVDQDWLLRMLRERIADERLLHLIERMLKCGVVDAGVGSKTEVGTPQGAVISPILGNIYLHYVLDLWAHRWRRKQARGAVYVVRYADDSVLGFQYRDDGERFRRELGERLAKFGLSLNERKTRLLEFGRFAADNRRKRGAGKPETFDFLGFTHICARRRSDGGFKLLRVTNAQQQRRKLQGIRRQLMALRHRNVLEIGRWLKRVIEGYFNYFAVPGNVKALDAFRREIARAWLRALRRRSQKGAKLTWASMKRLIEHFLPKARVRHPYPNERLRV